MPSVIRRLRAVAVLGMSWGLVWAGLGAVLGVIYGLVRPQDVDLGETPAAIARTLGLAGFISGAGFAFTLSLLERGRTLLKVSLLRVALWGAAGGAIIPLLTSVHDSQVFWTCPLGALLAMSSVQMARHAERRQLANTGAASLPNAGARGLFDEAAREIDSPS